ncbi:hypothetical protein FRB94_013168 [Tulasnella sp. JGI-2019a]|nr:hypothetical protein FRB94_013168 [Tulasnella sp. JGI-2019a]
MIKAGKKQGTVSPNAMGGRAPRRSSPDAIDIDTDPPTSPLKPSNDRNASYQGSHQHRMSRDSGVLNVCAAGGSFNTASFEHAMMPPVPTDEPGAPTTLIPPPPPPPLPGQSPIFNHVPSIVPLSLPPVTPAYPSSPQQNIASPVYTPPAYTPYNTDPNVDPFEDHPNTRNQAVTTESGPERMNRLQQKLPGWKDIKIGRLKGLADPVEDADPSQV